MNSDSWPEVCNLFEFKVKQSITCLKCYHTNHVESSQMYIELQVPPDMSILNKSLEEFLNQSELVTKKCVETCKVEVQAKKRTQLMSGRDVNFLTVVMTRSIWSNAEFKVIQNRIIAVNELFVR